MISAAQETMKIKADLSRFAAKAKKFGTKLPWAGMDADGGEEYEFGDEMDEEDNPKLFSMAEYKHTSATDDADVAEEQEEENEEMDNVQGDDILLHDDDSSADESD